MGEGKLLRWSMPVSLPLLKPPASVEILQGSFPSASCRKGSCCMRTPPAAVLEEAAPSLLSCSPKRDGENRAGLGTCTELPAFGKASSRTQDPLGKGSSSPSFPAHPSRRGKTAGLALGLALGCQLFVKPAAKCKAHQAWRRLLKGQGRASSGRGAAHPRGSPALLAPPGLRA